MRAQARRIQERFPTETAGTCSTCVGKSNKIGVSNRRANGPLMQLNVNFNGSRRLEQCPWIVATDAQCDGQVPCSRKNFGPDLRPFPRDLWCSTSPKRRARWMPRGPSPPRQSVRQHGCTDRLGERPLYPSLRSDSRRTGGSPGETATHRAVYVTAAPITPGLGLPRLSVAREPTRSHGGHAGSRSRTRHA